MSFHEFWSRTKITNPALSRDGSVKLTVTVEKIYILLQQAHEAGVKDSKPLPPPVPPVKPVDTKTILSDRFGDLFGGLFGTKS